MESVQLTLDNCFVSFVVPTGGDLDVCAAISAVESVRSQSAEEVEEMLKSLWFVDVVVSPLAST